MSLSQIEKRKIKTRDLYTKICIHLQLYHNFPSYRWLAKNTDLGSTSVVSYHLDILEEMGHIQKIRHLKESSWMVSGSAWLFPAYSHMLSLAEFDRALGQFLIKID